MKKYTNAEEIATAFVKKGWSADTSFSELTMEEANENGYSFAASEIKKGKKVFKMDGNGNIYSETGKIMFYNVKSCLEVCG